MAAIVDTRRARLKMMSQHIEDVSAEEMARRAAALYGG